MNHRTKLDDALEKLRADLRGPNGKMQGTICLPRALAVAVYEALEAGVMGK
jgi:hypothetical protein